MTDLFRVLLPDCLSLQVSEDLKWPAILISQPVAETTHEKKRLERKDDMVEWAKLQSALAKPGRPWPLKHSYLVTSFNAFTRDQQTSGREAEKKERKRIQKQMFTGIRFSELSSSKNSVKKLNIIFHTIPEMDGIYSTTYKNGVLSSVSEKTIPPRNSPFSK